jgi:hypothetical protein
VIRNEDDFFIRNRKRTTASWQKLKEIDNKTKVEEINGESDEEQNWRNKKKKLNEQIAPRWQRMLSEKLSDGPDDDDDDILEVTEVDKSQSPVHRSKGKERSRSRSVTPPPSVPFLEIQRARNIVRQALELPHRTPSPELLDADESTDTIILNSELASLAKSVELQSLQPEMRYTSHSTSERDIVKIIVKWQPHPKDTNEAASPSAYTMNRDESLQALFEAVADEYATLPQNLVLTYKGRRLYSSTSPDALNIWVEAEFAACNTTTYAYLRANSLADDGYHSAITPVPATRTPSCSSKAEAIDVNSDDDIVIVGASQPAQPEETQAYARSQSHAHDSDAESEADSDKFKIVLQSSLTQGRHIALTVRPTTKCGAIVKAFLKKAGLTDQYSHVFDNAASARQKGRKSQKPQKDPRICVDGEKMSNDTAIGDADLEDGDMVEVVGL